MNRGFLALGLALVANAMPATAGDWSLIYGLDYSSGKYGGSHRSETWYLPIIGKYEDHAMTYKVTLPYLRTTGPGGVSVGPDLTPLPGTRTSRRTESGLGDVVLSASWTALDGAGSGLLLDVVAKLKLPTGDEKRGLSTGEADYALQVDVARRFGPVTGFGTLGWKKFGDPPGSDFRNPIYTSLGMASRLNPDLTAGISYDWRQKILKHGAETSEATLFLSQRLSAATKIQLYLVNGFSDASPDWGGGLMLNQTF